MRIEKFDISKNYNGLKTFDCGNEMINGFVKKSLKKRVKKYLSQAYVLLEDEVFVGFYTLDAFSISREGFDIEYRPTGLPPVIPVIKLGMLGIDKTIQGNGIGKRMFSDVLRKVVHVSGVAGCAGIYLLAEKDAVSFYEKLGFMRLKDNEPLPMFLSIQTILDNIK